MYRIEFRSRRCIVLSEEALKKQHYLVDYDFPGITRESRTQYDHFYHEFEKRYGQKIGKFRSTASVIMVNDLSMAREVAQMVRKDSRIVHIRKCELIE
jgi:trehalose-6-phosphate synthase